MEEISAEEVIALIDRIIEEHRVFLQTLDQVANDAQAMLGLEKAQQAFMPGRLEEKQSLQKMQGLLATVDQGMRAHFNREETRLLPAFEKYGDKKLVSALESLLTQHADLRQRFSREKELMAELTSGKLSRHIWEASAQDMRAHISHTHKVFEAHARSEQKLLHTLRSELMKTQG